jgi:SAM-dependent methyltransferase
MRDIGFTNFTGADPYIDSDIVHPNGAQVLKRQIDEIDEQFDFVLLNHSFEHVWDQGAFIESVRRVVRTSGKCVIRVPTTDSWAWDHYQADWVQLDPPRHFYLHSRRSIRLILEKHGFAVSRIVDDSTEFQQLGSEMVRAGKPLADGEVFSRQTVAAARRTARRLNAEGRGDQIAVHCTKIS